MAILRRLAPNSFHPPHRLFLYSKTGLGLRDLCSFSVESGERNLHRHCSSCELGPASGRHRYLRVRSERLGTADPVMEAAPRFVADRRTTKVNSVAGEAL